MNIASAKDQVRDMVEAYLAKDDMGIHRMPVERQRPILLMGAPGIGKTAIIRQVAGELGIGLLSYSMTHHTRQSVLGLPQIVHDEFEGIAYDASEYTMSEIVASMYAYMKRTGLRQGILFLDEINCVSETLYPSMLQFLQFKTFGSHKVPDDWVIVCAGNPPEYNRAVHLFDIVTLDRLREITIEPDYAAWKTYASQRELHPAVTTFLEAKSDCFYLVQSKPGGQKCFVTARGWEDLAETISLYEQMGKHVDRDLIGQFVRDDDIADKFATYYELFQKYRSDYQVAAILDGAAPAHIADRARRAKFDERVALLGLMLDMIGSSCADALQQEAITLAVRDDLRQAKPLFMGEDAPGDDHNGQASADDILGDIARHHQEVLERKQRSGTLDAASLREQRAVIGLLRSFSQRCQLDGKLAGPPAFDVINRAYKAEVEQVESLVRLAQAHIDNAFGFIDQIFGNKRESLVFMAELATRASTTSFLARFGNDAYYAHNDELQVDSMSADIAQRIAQLKLDEPASGIQADADDAPLSPTASRTSPLTAAARDKLERYYAGKQLEYGFTSLCKMLLPDDLQGKTVLDVGCRRGKGVYKLSARVGRDGHVIGVDWSPEFIEQAKAGMQRASSDNGMSQSNMEFLLAYPESLVEAGLGNETVDVVYINNVATLLADQQAAYSEFARVLKPGGVLVCETIVSDVSRIEWVVEAARGIGNSIQAARTLSELYSQLENAGFSHIQIVDEYAVEPDQGFEKGTSVEVVSSSENVNFSAVCIHAVKAR